MELNKSKETEKSHLRLPKDCIELLTFLSIHPTAFFVQIIKRIMANTGSCVVGFLA